MDWGDRGGLGRDLVLIGDRVLIYAPAACQQRATHKDPGACKRRPTGFPENCKQIGNAFPEIFQYYNAPLNGTENQSQ